MKTACKEVESIWTRELGPKVGLVSAELIKLLKSIQRLGSLYAPFILGGKKYRVAKISTSHLYWIDCEAEIVEAREMMKPQAYIAQRNGKLYLVLRTPGDICWFEKIGWAVQLLWRLYLLKEQPTTEPQVESLAFYSPKTSKRLVKAVRAWRAEPEEPLE